MIKVWILLMLLNGDARGYGATNGPTIIDNLATKAECERVGGYLSAAIPETSRGRHFCIEAWKRVQP